MKALHILAILLLCSGLFVSCKKDDSTTPTGKVTVSFKNEIDGQPLVLGPLNYTNAAGNKYSVDLLKYYVSHFTLVKSDGSQQVFSNHELIDAGNPASLSFTLDSVKNGDYTSVRFYLGVDSMHNHSGAQDGDLDPVNGMIWTWSTGYIFYKHEGNYKDASGNTHPLVFHLGTDNALSTITVPISTFSVAGNNRKLFLKLNVNSAYSSSFSNMDFNVNNNQMSSTPDDIFWIMGMKNNLADAFIYNKAE